MRLADVAAQIKTVLVDGTSSLEARFEKSLVLAADFICQGIGRTGNKSIGAVLMVEEEEGRRHMIFAYPPHLSTGNYLPVNGDSIAGRVVQGKNSLIVNNVKEESHQGVFELIPDPGGNVRAIQKMIASPLLDGEGNVFAVMEVSRTGGSPQDAGPDFTPQDISNLEACCRAFAPYIHRIWTAVAAQG